jgi:hypothetical protein
MNPRVAVIVATGVLVSYGSAAADAVTCTFPGNLAVFTVNKADQSVHAEFSNSCQYDLTGTVKRAEPRRVKASNLDGGVTSGTPCCETMSIDFMKWREKTHRGKMIHSFVCSGVPGPPLLNTAMTCE